MLRKTMIVLAMTAALPGALADDASALATGHTGWDGLGDGGGQPILSQTIPKRTDGRQPLHHKMKRGAGTGTLRH
jgi:hypothetical protein